VFLPEVILSYHIYGFSNPPSTPRHSMLTMHPFRICAAGEPCTLLSFACSGGLRGEKIKRTEIDPLHRKRFLLTFIVSGVVRVLCRRFDPMVGDPMVGEGGRTTDDGRRTTDDGRRTTDDGRTATDDRRRTTDDGRRMADDGRRTKGD
jgi:hypothetical protein